MATQERVVPAFSAIELRGIGDLHITQGDQAAVRIEADEDVISEIVTEVVGDRLVIRLDPWKSLRFWGASRRADFYITVPGLTAVTVSGSGTVDMPSYSAHRLEFSINGTGNVRANIGVNELKVGISGSGDVVMTGIAHKQEARITGAGTYSALGLQSKDTTISIGGAGKASVQVTDSLDVSIGGAGTVSYSGAPRVTQRIGGFGKVEQV
jgi:hypothetical protein